MRASFFPVALVACVYTCGAAEEPTISLTLPELRSMLAASTPVTRADIEKRFGAPLNKHDGVHGRLMYATAKDRYVIFTFKGPYITEARMGKEAVAGFSPKTFSMLVIAGTDQKPHRFHFDGAEYEGVEKFKEHLKTLPAGAIVEWQGTCDVSGDLPKKESEELQKFIESLGLFVGRYPAG